MLRPVIALESVTKTYFDGEGREIPAVADVTLTVADGELVALIGTSGSGKTTLLKMINRLVTPTRGSVRVGGEDVAAADPIRLRRGIGYVVQSGGLLPHLTVAGNVGLLGPLEGQAPARVRARVDELLARVHLPPETFRDRLPSSLSGGQRQRVGVARALFLDPPVVLLDEPFGALDPVTRRRVRDEFKELRAALGKTAVLVTHDLAEAFDVADRVALIDDGRLLQVGTEDALRSRPADESVSRFLRAHFEGTS